MLDFYRKMTYDNASYRKLYLMLLTGDKRPNQTPAADRSSQPLAGAGRTTETFSRRDLKGKILAELYFIRLLIDKRNRQFIYVDRNAVVPHNTLMTLDTVLTLNRAKERAIALANERGCKVVIRSYRSKNKEQP
jgi:hypothetical protein